MALQSTTQIFIEGTEITSFKGLSLFQAIDSHHYLELVCRMDVLENMSTDLGAESKNFLGQTLSMMISSFDSLSGYENLEFKGIVTSVKNVKGFMNQSGDEIVIVAQSPTFLADDGPHYASYYDVSLSEIIEKSFQEYDQSKLELLIGPSNDAPIHYSVQNRESAFRYASRLAAQYGEWFYYNGKELVFGIPEDEEMMLTYGIDLKEYHLTLLPQAQNYKFITSDYLTDEIHEKDGKEITAGVNGFNGFVANKALTIFNKETQIYVNQYDDTQTKDRFEASVEVQKKSIEINQVQLSGISDNPGVKLGNIVNIEGGRYRVTRITHTTNEVGDYENRFEAITAEFDAYPKTNIQSFPHSESQTAIVMENIDPDGLGRIRVQFPWQKEMAEMTPWIRIVTPHAGSEKGFQFTPEIGEEVLIGFEGGNAERPYMLGSLYNGNAKAEEWKTADNDIKAIRTRSGHTVEFNDKDGEESITIVDKNGNSIVFNTKEKTIILSSEEKIMLDSKFIYLHAEDINLEAKNIQIAGSEAIANQVGSSGTYMDNSNISIDSVNVGVNGKKEVSVNGAEIKTNSSGPTNINGAIVKINS